MALILNLGCGTRASAHPEVVNIDWSVMLRIRRNPVLRVIAPALLHGDRLIRFRTLPANILVHDLSKGIPFASGTADVVYHSHVLEHFDRDIARTFLAEVKRVLKPGGIHRIVVPDLEKLCKSYIDHLSACERDPPETEKHDEYVSALIEQSVRRRAAGTSGQKPWRQFVENTLLGDARRRGETHQWMYDRVNLCTLMTDLGFRNVRVLSHETSAISSWSEIGLDIDESGNEYKAGSLYVEACK